MVKHNILCSAHLVDGYNGELLFLYMCGRCVLRISILPYLCAMPYFHMYHPFTTEYRHTIPDTLFLSIELPGADMCDFALLKTLANLMWLQI